MIFPGSRFVIGDWENGFGLAFELQPDRSIKGRIRFDENKMGPPGIVHGGVLATMVDEAMTARAFQEGVMVFTANLNIDYKAPVFIGTEITITAQLDRVEGRKIYVTSEVRLPDDTLALTATGLFLGPKV